METQALLRFDHYVPHRNIIGQYSSSSPAGRVLDSPAGDVLDGETVDMHGILPEVAGYPGSVEDGGRYLYNQSADLQGRTKTASEGGGGT